MGLACNKANRKSFKLSLIEEMVEKLYQVPFRHYLKQVLNDGFFSYLSEDWHPLIAVCGQNHHSLTCVIVTVPLCLVIVFTSSPLLSVFGRLYFMIMAFPGPSCSKLTTSLVNDSLKF